MVSVLERSGDVCKRLALLASAPLVFVGPPLRFVGNVSDLGDSVRQAHRHIDACVGPTVFCCEMYSTSALRTPKGLVMGVSMTGGKDVKLKSGRVEVIAASVVARTRGVAVAVTDTVSKCGRISGFSLLNHCLIGDVRKGIVI